MSKRILVTDSDARRLERMLESPHRGSAPALQALEQELDRADIVASASVAANVVTMHSRVRLHDLDRDTEFGCTIVFPAEADSEHNRVSVLAPLGTALLGYRVGQIVRFMAPGGLRRIKITAIEYQPEAAARDRTVEDQPGRPA